MSSTGGTALDGAGQAQHVERVGVDPACRVGLAGGMGQDKRRQDRKGTIGQGRKGTAGWDPIGEKQ